MHGRASSTEYEHLSLSLSTFRKGDDADFLKYALGRIEVHS
jgi:hypothetical protein